MVGWASGRAVDITAVLIAIVISIVYLFNQFNKTLLGLLSRPIANNPFRSFSHVYVDCDFGWS